MRENAAKTSSPIACNASPPARPAVREGAAAPAAGPEDDAGVFLVEDPPVARDCTGGAFAGVAFPGEALRGAALAGEAFGGEACARETFADRLLGAAFAPFARFARAAEPGDFAVAIPYPCNVCRRISTRRSIACLPGSVHRTGSTDFAPRNAFVNLTSRPYAELARQMYVVAIAWLYVALMVSVTQPTIFRGLVTFVGTGLFPLALLLYLVGTPQRRRNQRRASGEQTERSVEPDQ